MSGNSIALKPFVMETNQGICVATPTRDGRIVFATEDGAVFANKPQCDTVSLGCKKDWVCNAPPYKPKKDSLGKKILKTLVLVGGGAALAYWQRGNITKGIEKITKYAGEHGVDFSKMKFNKETWNTCVEWAGKQIGKAKVKV